MNPGAVKGKRSQQGRAKSHSSGVAESGVTEYNGFLNLRRNSIMAYEEYFPRGVATGSAFCNRERERKRLAQNIDMGQHTLLMSPRRYGKTSLVRYVINEMNVPYGESDLFVAVDSKRIEQRVLAGVKMVFGNVSTSTEETLRSVRAYFKKMNSKWVIGTQGVNIALIPDHDSDPATNIMEALSALENLLTQKKKRAVLFLDEIQEIGEVAEGKGIEGAIRHVAQESKYLSFVFSGSSRHLLANMFFDKARPLYKLCDQITLERISAEDYWKHLDKLAKKRWGSVLTESAMERIFAVTELHPYYVNNLCLRIWESNLKSAPTSQNVADFWQLFIEESKQETARELSSLSPGQRKIMIAMVSGTKKGFISKQFLKIVGMTGSSVSEALHVLEDKDYVERIGEEYSIIDPLIKASLNLYFL